MSLNPNAQPFTIHEFDRVKLIKTVEFLQSELEKTKKQRDQWYNHSQHLAQLVCKIPRDTIDFLHEHPAMNYISDDN